MSFTVSSLSVLALAALGDVASARNVIAKREFSRPSIGNVPYGSEVISCTKPGVIALTFDDGPGPLTEGIVDTLEENGVKGTFFVVGKNGEDGMTTGDYDGLLQRMHKAGHHLGSHSFSHPNFNKISYDEKVKELEDNEKAFADILGVIPTYFRPPYTACDGECYQALGDMGYHVTDYDLDTKDWENNGRDAEEKYSSAVKAGNPDVDSFISLSHDIQPFTADGFVQFMIDVGKEKGFKFVTLGECLGDPSGNWYRDPESGEAIGGSKPDPKPEPSTTKAEPTKTPEAASTTTTSTSTTESSTAEPSATAGPGIQKENDSSSAVESSSSVEISTTHVSVVESSTVTHESSTFITTYTTSSASIVTSSPSSSLPPAAEQSGDSEDNDGESAATLSGPSLLKALLAGAAAWMLL